MQPISKDIYKEEFISFSKCFNDFDSNKKQLIYESDIAISIKQQKLRYLQKPGTIKPNAINHK